MQRIDLGMQPREVLQAWPRDRALALLASPERATEALAPTSPWARWTLFAEPSETHVVQPGDATIVPPVKSVPSVHQAVGGPSNPDTPPLSSGWIGSMSYDLGATIEPLARWPGRGTAPRTSNPAWPLAVWHRCERLLAFDRENNQWWATRGPECAALVDSLRSRAAAHTQLRATAEPAAFSLGPLQSDWGREGYELAVRRAVEYIFAGDVFQANIAHRMSAPFSGSARSLMAALWQSAEPWFGAYLELPDDTGASAGAGSHAPATRRAIVSISPELLVKVDPQFPSLPITSATPPSRRIVTRPMKGTRRAGDDAAASAARLAKSEKDAAELNMIIDLMRNDIGRVCSPATVRVDEVRTIERHARGTGQVLQGVATVSGELRPGTNPEEIVRAVFPGGSVTGAPRIRAMQIIDELEPVPRGPYCGSIGFLGDDGSMMLSVAIRTCLLSGPGEASTRDGFLAGTRLEYSAGAGIVAASDPAAEWQETLDKAAVITSIAGASRG